MLVTFKDIGIYNRMFEQFVLDRGMELNSEADTRCAIKVYSNYIMNMLADLYDVDQEEIEPSKGCKNCCHSYTSANANNHNFYCQKRDWMAVDGDEICSNWKQKG